MSEQTVWPAGIDPINQRCEDCGAEPGEECRPYCTGEDQRDNHALNAIAEMLRDPEWGVGMLEDIAELVKGTGRTIENYPDGRPTWDRH